MLCASDYRCRAMLSSSNGGLQMVSDTSKYLLTDDFRYIIASSVGSLFCELLIGFGHPLPLFPYPLMLGGGLLPWLNLPPTGNNVYAGTLGLSFVVMTYCNASMFAFRFGQTVDSRWIKIMAIPKYGFGLAVSFIGVLGVGMMLPMASSVAPVEDMRRLAKVADPTLYALIKDQPFIGLKVIACFA